MDIQTLLAFSIYLSILITIGLISYSKTKNSKDFILGSRSLNYWVTAISAHASDMSSWLLMGFPAAVYANGLIEIWTALGLTIFMFLNWHYIAPKLRTETEKYNSLTLSSYFEARYNDTTGSIRLLSSTATLFFFTFYISSGLVGMGRLFELILNINYTTGIIIGTCIIIFYTLIGGYFAVSWNDLFQGLFLMIMIILVPILAFNTIAGWESIKLFAKLRNVPLNIISLKSLASVQIILFLAVDWGLGYFGQPHILTKFMGIKKVEEMKKAKLVGITWQILTLGAAIFVGVVGLAFFSNGLNSVAQQELIFVFMVKRLFSPFFAGFVLCAILAAILSTIDSQILASASVLSEDIYRKTFKKNATQKQLLFSSRFSVFMISGLAFFIAFNSTQGIYDLVRYPWTGLGCSFGPLLILSLYSKKITSHGAISGIIVGATTAGLWPYFNLSIPAMLPAFSLSLASIYLVSLIQVGTNGNQQ